MEKEHWTNRPIPAVTIGVSLLVVFFVVVWYFSGMPPIVIEWR